MIARLPEEALENSRVPNCLLTASQDIRSAAELEAQFQYALSDRPRRTEPWAPLVNKLARVSSVQDATSDQQIRGLQANVVIDRDAAARLGFNRRPSITRFTTRSANARSPPSTHSTTSIT